MLKLLDKHRDAKPSTFVRTGCAPLLLSPHFTFSAGTLLFCMLHAASRSHTSSSSSSSCPLLPTPFGAAQLLHFISVRQPTPLLPPPLCHSSIFFCEWLVFAMYHVCLSPSLSVCVCESRFCVQVRSFNFDLCFRLFCVAFVDFCHLNRNFYFPHVSRHAQTPQQQEQEEQEQQPSPVFAFVCSFSRHCFYERMS